MGRKSKATLAAEAAAVQELGKIETVEGEVVVTDLEPASDGVVVEAPVSVSVDPDGEDLGDVTNQPVETPVIEDDEAVDPTEEVVEGEEPSEAPDLEQDSQATIEQQAITDEINKEIVKELVEIVKSVDFDLEDDFKPILRPTSVAGELIGHIPCPKAVFDLVQKEGWEQLINSHNAKHGLKSVLYWKRKNGSAVVRCMSSSRFADVV